MKRRDFLTKALQLSALPLLQGHFPLHFGIKNFQVYWLHIEGAPLRETFDFWPDPQGRFKVETIPAGQRPLYIKRGKQILPNIWHNLGAKKSSYILDHWLSVRGISLKGPHLKEARYQWFRNQDDSEQSIFQSFNQVFKECGLPPSDLFSSDPTLVEIYRDILKSKITYSPTDNALKSIFNHWEKNTQSPNDLKSPLSLGLIRSPSLKSENEVLFENLDQWTEETRLIHENFFSQLLSEINHFISYLERAGTFKHSALLITSDRRKAPTNTSQTPALEPVWEGGHFSLISGAINGPVTLGDIYRNHPKYQESYPMTWGASKINYSPGAVHQLIMDLCLAETRPSHYNPEEENPWVAARSFQGLYIKGLPGRVI